MPSKCGGKWTIVSFRFYLFLGVISILNVSADPAKKIQCVQTPKAMLFRILGPAYNARYMSAEKPNGMDGKIDDKRKRHSSAVAKDPMAADQQVPDTQPEVPDFHVDESYVQALPLEMPSTDSVMGVGSDTTARTKRDTAKWDPWMCQSSIKWIDLGNDYFPRYLRGVECVKRNCWFGHFQCKAKAFTVKVLRRKSDSCSLKTTNDAVNGEETNLDGLGAVDLPEQLREHWEFVERGVAFCCDCSLV